MFVASGKGVPLDLTPSDYLELLCCPSSSSEYIQKNQILRMIRGAPIRAHNDDWLIAELRTAEDSAQTLVFDCSHEEEMRISDQKNLARQLAMAFANNRTQRPFPFHFMFTSLVPGTNQYKFFEEAFGTGVSSNRCNSLEMCPFSVRPDHFSEVIKDRRLIYLSPNAPRAFEIGEYDHDAVYVVGGIVDKAVRRPVTHAKARRAGWECIRLPLERYVDWRSGNKTLTLVAIHSILATAKATNGDWKTALEQNIPSRFLQDHDAVQKDINRLFRSI
nr:mitochondrial ribonuclease p protein 1 [Hymenolepis microstoma]